MLSNISVQPKFPFICFYPIFYSLKPFKEHKRAPNDALRNPNPKKPESNICRGCFLMVKKLSLLLIYNSSGGFVKFFLLFWDSLFVILLLKIFLLVLPGVMLIELSD